MHLLYSTNDYRVEAPCVLTSFRSCRQGARPIWGSWRSTSSTSEDTMLRNSGQWDHVRPEPVPAEFRDMSR